MKLKTLPSFIPPLGRAPEALRLETRFFGVALLDFPICILKDKKRMIEGSS
ncbi:MULTISPECIES: hypothetical protein [unclassified Brevibacillus]|uniref:hypothetical protein n=1 Tax=unclassified Brevibacillus TaxID=2684853 RepID=UPI00356354DD